MVATKGAAAATKNYQDSISGAAGKYKDGVGRAQNTIENAIAAEPLYAAKVQESIANGSRVKGLQKTSTAEWRKNAQEKGSVRIGPGMTAALPKFNRGITEVISTIEGVSIAPRTADPMANIDARVKPIAQALYDMKRK